MTKRVVLIGHPVAHSLSGAMQQAAFDSVGMDAAYELWDRTPMELADAIGPELVEAFTILKRGEWDRYLQAVEDPSDFCYIHTVHVQRA